MTFPHRSLDTLLKELERLDRSLNTIPIGEFSTLGPILHQRAAIIGQTVHALAALPQPTPEQRSALARSYQAGCQTLRQLILAQHMLATELSHAKQEQRLWDTLSGQSDIHPNTNVNLQG